MAICINCDGICFGSYSITPSPTGICIDGLFSHQGTEVNPTQAQGSVSGYSAGGRRSSSPAPSDTSTCSCISKFPFAGGTISAADGGELVQGKYGATGHSSSTHGYSAGGDKCGTPPSPTRCVPNIDKFPFSSDTATTDIGDVFSIVGGHGFSGHSSTTDGYRVLQGNLEKFPFLSDTNSADVTEMVINQGSAYNNGISSRDTGYTSGGSPPGPTDVILKFPFASDTVNSDVAELTTGRCEATNTNSAENGYILSGILPPSPSPTNFLDSVEKFPFANETPASDISEVSRSMGSASGQSSTTDGYMFGGARDPSTPTSGNCIIQKHNFATDGNAACVGTIGGGDNFRGSGHQV